jgi:transposase
MDARELRQYEHFKAEAQRLRAENQHLRLELRALRPALYRADQRIDRLEQANQRYRDENKRLKQKLADLTARLQQQPRPAPPSFVKANVPPKTRRRRPGRKKGHPAALRPLPQHIDQHEQVDLPVDQQGKLCCPQCHSQLSDVARHERLVEELVPAQRLTICYHTTSGWCPCCRRKIESRAADQPPAADLPHAQLGLNAIATAVLMRVAYRLPLRQISRLLGQLPGLHLSPAAIVKQLRRVSRWLGADYDHLLRVIRASAVVHADETGWRTSGRNGFLWTICSGQHTAYHVDRSRGAKVIADLLGKGFGYDGQTLVSDFYSVYDQFDARQQKCLTHLLRELRELTARRPELAGHAFFRRCKRLIRDMLALAKRRRRLKKADYQRKVDRVERRLEALAEGQWGDADADRLSRRLGKYRQKLTTFLHKPQVDPTNNAAERALRPAVVMRKITGGSRSEQGARAWAILASIMRTAEQQGRDVLETLKALLRSAWAGLQPQVGSDTS